MRSIFTFIIISYFSILTGTGQEFLITTQKSSIHSGPAATFNQIAELHKGTLVYIIDDYGEWTAVQYKNLNGFMPTKFLDVYTTQQYDASDQITAIQKQTQIDIEQAQLQMKQKIKEAQEAYTDAMAKIEQERIASQQQIDEDLRKIQAQLEQENKIAEHERQQTLLEIEEAKKRARDEENGIGLTHITSSTNSAGISSTKESYTNWEKIHYNTGDTPASFKVKNTYDTTLDNYLKVTVGKDTDAIVKLYKMGDTEKEDQCIRITYIKNSSTQYIKNIPEGEYYLKIAYGLDWRETTKNGKHYGTFTKNALYERNPDVLDFRVLKTEKGITIPSYNLSLEILSNGEGYGDGNRDHISADQFNDF